MWSPGLLDTFKSEVEKSHKVLLITEEECGQDLKSANTVIVKMLKGLGKEVFVTSESEVKGGTLLPRGELILSFAYAGEKVQKLRYHITKDEVVLSLTPFSGNVQNTDIRVESKSTCIDLVIVFGMQRRGRLLDEALAFLHDGANVTIVNVDINDENTSWATINIVAKEWPLYVLLALYLCKVAGGAMTHQMREEVLSALRRENPSLLTHPVLLRFVADLLESGSS